MGSGGWNPDVSKTWCFYHKDQDGKCAGYWVRDFLLKNNNPPNLEMVGIDYNDEFPMHKIGPNDTVYMVDFSLSPEKTVELDGECHRFIWIDHHDSPFKKFAEAGIDIHQFEGIRQQGMAGCELTWLWLNGLEATEENRVKIPIATRLVGDYDVWKFQYSGTESFHAGVELYPHEPWDMIWRDVHTFPGYTKHMEHLTDQGQVVLHFQYQQRKGTARENVFWAYLDGYKAACINTTLRSSKLFEDFVDPASCDIYLAYNYTGKDWRVSIYVPEDGAHAKIHAGDICKNHGGGGHKGAAGFHTEDFMFLVRDDNDQKRMDICFVPPWLIQDAVDNE